VSTKVLVVDDKQAMRDSIATTLQRGGFQVVTAPNGQAALKMVTRHEPIAIVTDLKMPELDGLGLIEKLGQSHPGIPVVLMSAYGTIDVAVEAMKQGAFDFVQKPFDAEHLVATVRRAVDGQLQRRGQAQPASAGNGSDDQAHADSAQPAAPVDGPVLVGRSKPMRDVATQVHQVARSNGTVLICGESGTGKEVIARTIHAHSPRADKVMLCVNCAALSSSLLESELFGHEKGAFTGADHLRKGRFELADGGTLLLDEISEISPELQAKLLRVLQERAFERVGSSVTMNIDVRVIATTNRDLSQEVASGEFRQDLYYRLNVLPLHLPALRERQADIPALAEHFLRLVAAREEREPKRLHPEAMDLMAEYPWPGNVRELQNICERASVLSRGQVIKPDTIRPWLVPPPTAPAPAPEAGGMDMVGASMGAPTGPRGVVPLEDVERQQILSALDRFGGNRTKTAQALGIGVRTLGLKLKKWKEANLVAASV